MAHSKIEDRPTYGENVYYANLKYVPGSLPVHSWYSEAKEENYKYGMEPPNLRAGIIHLTSLIFSYTKNFKEIQLTIMRGFLRKTIF